MQTQEYQKLALRTECDNSAAERRMISSPNYLGIRLNHGANGLAGEAGELNGAVERHIYYGKELDRVNLVEELGDCLWYIAIMCDALNVTIEELMEKNIAKLQLRFPQKFTEHLAAEENRDRVAERKVLEADCMGQPTGKVLQMDGTGCYTESGEEQALPPGKTVFVSDEVKLTEEQKRYLKESSDHWVKRASQPSPLLAADKRAFNETLHKQALDNCTELQARQKVREHDHYCPNCHLMVNDEIARLLLCGKMSFAGCPECLGQLTKENLKCHE